MGWTMTRPDTMPSDAMSLPPVDPPRTVSSVESFRHEPVLLQAVLDYVPPGVKLIVDATVGGGGHAQALLERFPKAELLGCDRDPTAVEAARERLAVFPGRVLLKHLAFSDLPDLVPAASADFLLADLGVSSPQLDVGERGFSFTRDGPLDMRMDPTRDGLTAATLVNSATREELLDILHRLGEERFARRIFSAIEAARPLESTGALARVVAGAVPRRHHRRGHHPATKTFQALRMAVNDELGELERLLDRALELLKPGGRLAVISFHSLEDRLVKSIFRAWESPCTCPPNMPRCICGEEPRGRRVTRKPFVATPEEQARNPRSRSAKLRVFEKN